MQNLNQTSETIATVRLNQTAKNVQETEMHLNVNSKRIAIFQYPFIAFLEFYSSVSVMGNLSQVSFQDTFTKGRYVLSLCY